MFQANVAQLAKGGWKICGPNNSLWKELFNARYLKGKHIMNYNFSQYDYVVWKGFYRNFNAIKTGMKWS